LVNFQSGPEELVLLEEHPIERPWGWVFHYSMRGWRDGDYRYAVGGNGPILINRANGAMRFCGSAFSDEHYIQEYEAELTAHNGGNE
jgi:hypothetical protein